MVDGYTLLVPTVLFDVTEIFSVHYFEYTNDYVYDGEAHDFWEFCYVDKGEIEVTTADGQLLLDHAKIPLEHGQILFHRPGEFHSLRANGVVAPNLVVMSFSCHSPAMDWFIGKKLPVGDEERALLARVLEEASAAFLSPLDDPDLKKLVRDAGAPPGAEQLIKLYIENLLINLYRKGKQPQITDIQLTSTIHERSQQDALERVVRYFEANITRRLTLTEVCHDNLVGRSYLQKIFRAKTGGGAMEYFGRMKIEAAKRQIREGQHNFTEISAQLGYNSIHYFSRHFKKVTGMTPSEYASSVKMLIGHPHKAR